MSILDLVVDNNVIREFQREVCILYTKEHGFFGFRTDNSRGSVEFDFETVFNFLVGSNFEDITMFHTHPPGVLGMSSTDMELVKSWSMALNKPINFWIFPHGEFNTNSLIYNKITRSNKITKISCATQEDLSNCIPLLTFCNILHAFSEGDLKTEKEFLHIEEEFCKSKYIRKSVDNLNLTLLKKIEEIEEIEDYQKYFIIHSNKEGQLVIPDSVTVLGTNAFSSWGANDQP